MNSKNWRLWQPPTEAIDAIATKLGEHWAAARSRHVKLFWPQSPSWPPSLSWRKHVTATSEPAAEGSSDTLPDPRPC